MHKLF